MNMLLELDKTKIFETFDLFRILKDAYLSRANMLCQNDDKLSLDWSKELRREADNYDSAYYRIEKLIQKHKLTNEYIDYRKNRITNNV